MKKRILTTIQLFKCYLNNFVPLSARAYRLLFNAKMSPNISEIKLLNKSDGQFYSILEIQVQNAFVLFIDGNILPIFSDNNLIKVKIPLKTNQSKIEIKARGLIRSVSKQVSVPQKSNMEFKTITFGRVGQILDKRILINKIKPSIRMMGLFSEDFIKIKTQEPTVITHQLSIKPIDFEQKFTVEEINIINQTTEVESELKKYMIYEK